MTRVPLFRMLAVLGLACLGLWGQGSPAASQNAGGQNVAGEVVNVTTGTPVAHATVTLVRLQGNMQPLATTTTDAAGKYRFSESTPGPFMVQAEQDGVPYFAQVAAGQTETNIQVYNAVHDAALLDVDAEIMVLQPDQGQLAVVNEYRIENGLKPARTLVNQGGIFRFRVPAGAQVDMVRVVGPGEMPLARQAQATSQHDVYGVDSPLRPGETRVQVSYRVPYGGLRAALTETPVTRPTHFEVYVPNPMKFQGDGFAQVGAQDGYTVYGIAPGAAEATMAFHVSGDAPMPAAASDGSAAGGSAAASGGTAGDDAGAAAAAAPVGATPAPTLLERNRWTILILLGLAALAGFGFLLAQPQTAAAGVPAGVPAAPADPVGRLKDDLFALELRRRRGELDEAEYARLRAELDGRLAAL